MIRVENKTSEVAEIYISGDIIDDADGGFISDWWGNTDGYEWPKKIRTQLDELKGKDLTIYINSYGGSVPAGVAMANMIARHEGNTTAIVDGYCCSIATQIFFSAKNRKMPSNAYLMIHKPATAVAGDANEMRKVAEILDVLQEGIETTYRKAALDDTDADMIHDMVEEETWLTGEEAAQFFDIELMEESKAVACAGSKALLKERGFKSIPDLHFAEQSEDKRKDADSSKERGTEDKKKRIAIATAMAKGAITR